MQRQTRSAKRDAPGQDIRRAQGHLSSYLLSFPHLAGQMQLCCDLLQVTCSIILAVSLSLSLSLSLCVCVCVPSSKASYVAEDLAVRLYGRACSLDSTRTPLGRGDSQRM
jgi:hypothetical protein